MNNLDIRKADANYNGFPAFSKWSNLKVSKEKWDNFKIRFDKISETTVNTLKHAQNIVRRYAAIETGAIEKLYDTDRGFTWTVALELTGFESVLNEKGDSVSRLIESQMDTYDYILDIATGKQKIAEAWIRELHKELCKEQEDYKVMTSQGPQNHKLKHGTYKKQPNHVTQANGAIHSYCPVDMVGAEMHRFINELNSNNFHNSHPFIQAAYAHYAFVCIHPFSDGNGRVARALASVFLLRNLSIPFFVLSQDKENYIDSLESADEGEYSSLIKYTMESCFNAIDLIELSLKYNRSNDIKKSLAKLNKLYETKSGYTHQEIDSMASTIMNNFYKILREYYDPLKESPNLINQSIGTGGNNYSVPDNYRLLINGQGISYMIAISTKKPVSAHARIDYKLYIPKNFDKDDTFIIHKIQNNERLYVRLDEVQPSIKPSLLLKFNIFAEANINEIGNQLLINAEQSETKII